MGFMDGIWGSKEADVQDDVQDDVPPSEETPFTRESMKAAPDYLRGQAAKLYEMSKEGPLSFRIMAFLGGIAMVIAGTYDLIDTTVIDYSGSGILIAFYTIFFGAAICMLEGRKFAFPERWQRTIKFYFRILDYTWGKGVLYTFVGTLQMTQPTHVNNLVGTYMILVGLIALISSIGAGRKLSELRTMIDSQRSLRTCFNEYDSNKNGSLKQKEFAIMLGGLGVDVSYQEMYACFNTIDKNDDEKITYDEFYNWWNSWGKKNLHRGLSDIIV